MYHDDMQVGIPGTIYRDTKANIEALSSINEGAIAYATNTNEFGSYDGSSWTWGQGNSSPSSVSASVLVVQHQATQNTNSGSFTSGAWRTRTITTEVIDTGSIGSISSNQITLMSGTYTCDIFCCAYMVNRHQAKLYNVTDAADILLGSVEYTDSGGLYTAKSVINGAFTLTGQKVLEIQHQCSTTKADVGFGNPANFTTEVYLSATFVKIG